MLIRKLVVDLLIGIDHLLLGLFGLLRVQHPRYSQLCPGIALTLPLMVLEESGSGRAVLSTPCAGTVCGDKISPILSGAWEVVECIVKFNFFFYSASMYYPFTVVDTLYLH